MGKMNSVEVRWQAFREAKFRQDCSRIKLRKNGTQEIAYEGPGQFCQEHDGTLTFKCFCPDETGRSVRDMMHEFALPLGKLIPSDAYYSAHIETLNGEVWTAENISVHRQYSTISSLAVITGKLRQVKHVRETTRPSQHNSIRLLFIGQRLDDWTALIGPDISCNEIGCAIRVVAERGSDTLVQVTSVGKFGANFEVRVVEALRFVLAKVVHVSVIEHDLDGVVETELISPVHASSDTRLFPPLHARSSNDRANVRRLFERYLTFVHSRTSAEFVHPCSFYLRNACEASANALEAEVVGLCVAVEGIAKLIPYERSKIDDETFTYIQGVVKKWLTRRYCSRITDRVMGLLSQLMSDPVPKRLKPLIESGHLDECCAKAWGRLRNRSVHPTATKLEELDEVRTQELLNELHRVYVCMYQITFSLIGYKGTFSNYAREFRVDTFPISSAMNDA